MSAEGDLHKLQRTGESDLVDSTERELAVGVRVRGRWLIRNTDHLGGDETLTECVVGDRRYAFIGRRKESSCSSM